MEEAPRTHKGTIRQFNLHVLKEGPLPVSVIRVFAYAEDLREGADYELAATFHESTVEELIDHVAVFVRAVEELLPT